MCACVPTIGTKTITTTTPLPSPSKYEMMMLSALYMQYYSRFIGKWTSQTIAKYRFGCVRRKKTSWELWKETHCSACVAFYSFLVHGLWITSFVHSLRACAITNPFHLFILYSLSTHFKRKIIIITIFFHLLIPFFYSFTYLIFTNPLCWPCHEIIYCNFNFSIFLSIPFMCLSIFITSFADICLSAHTKMLV